MMKGGRAVEIHRPILYMKNIDWNNCKLYKYKVPIIGGMSHYYEVIAPNKTFARMIAQGETPSWIKVKGKIMCLGEVKDWSGELIENT